VRKLSLMRAMRCAVLAAGCALGAAAAAAPDGAPSPETSRFIDVGLFEPDPDGMKDFAP